MAAVFATFALTSFVHTAGLLLDVAGLLSPRVSSLWRGLAGVTFGLFFMIAGSAHFDSKLSKRLYLPMLAFLPAWARPPVNTAAGVVEVVVGVGALSAVVVGSQRLAEGSALAAVAVLLGVFPANIFVALSSRAQLATGQSQSFAVMRLFIQLTFWAWASWPLLPQRAR